MAVRSDDGVLIAVDVGTSGARASAFDLTGNRLLEVRRGYPTEMPRDEWAEQDARSWRNGSLSALGALIRRLQRGIEIHAIGLTGQCPSVVPIDRHGEPLRAGIIYRDNRAVAEAAALRQRFGAAAWHQRTGHVPEAFHVAAKLLWIQAHEPEVFRAAHAFVEPSDYVALGLTGELTTDWTIAAASALLDLRQRRWAGDLIEAAGLDPERLPTPRPSWAVIGALRPSLQKRFGLPKPVPVVAGAGDSIACAFGAGVTAVGPVSEMAGSSTCINTVIPEPLADLAVTHYPSATGETGYVTELGINTSGEAVDWLASLLYGGRSGRAHAGDFERLDREAATVPAGADGLVVIPVLGDGERDDPGLRGTIVGLSLRHGRAALARATLEGVAFAIRKHVEMLAKASGQSTELRVSGRSAGLKSWNQVKADVLGIPVVRIPGDATAAGVAMLAGLGVGVYSDAAVAVRSACRLDPPIEPDARRHEQYNAIYERYRALVAAPTSRVPAAMVKG
jgi:xylulokinase